MSKGKVIISIIACIAVLGGVGFAVFSYIGPYYSENYDKTIVYIGDSLCEALLGSSPLSERDSYGFYAVVGRRNNYRYVDASVSGDTTKGLYSRLTKTDSAAKVKQHWVSEADIIYISILGNDFLTGNVYQTMRELAEDDYTRVDNMDATAREYFAKCIERVKQLNPDAPIIVSTLYNPMEAGTNMITEQQKAELIAFAGGDSGILRTVGAKLLQTLNSVIFDYLASDPGAFEVIDVFSAFEKIYNNNREAGVALLYGDWLHPSNEGHAVIGDLLQAKLEEMGLADAKTALAEYKRIRLQQLTRLYAKTKVNTLSAKLKILASSSCEEVTSAYFDAVRGVTPDYSGVIVRRPSGKKFSEDRTFNLSALEMDGDDYSSFLDKAKSSFVFRKDGTFSVYLRLNSVSAIVVNSFLSSMGGGFNLETDLGSGNFATGIDVYIKNIFPGFDFRELEKDVELISSCGIYVHGLDFDKPEIKALADSLKENATIPAGFKLPDDFALEIRGYYYIQKEGEFTLLQMPVGNVTAHGSPYLYAVLNTDSDGSEMVELFLEVPKVRVEGRA
ncbi:MAG: SGNH/GDSL hydrolase family protein [Christensenellales bacterium]